MENPVCVPLKKPNYMLMSLQRIFVLFVIAACVSVVVYYTPMPGTELMQCLHLATHIAIVREIPTNGGIYAPM